MLLGTGCANTRGPQLVVNSHIDYNKAVSQVLKEELLLNVVRRRYMEPLQFVNVSSISTNISMTADVHANATLDNSATNASHSLGAGIANGTNFSRSASAVGNGLNFSNVGVDGGVTFSDSPTVTITPRQGEDIARQLHDPLPVSAVVDLTSVGYPIDTTLQMLVEGVNDVRGPTVGYDVFRPGSPEWREMMDLIKKFSDDGSFLIRRFQWNDLYTEDPYPANSITPEMWITTITNTSHRWKSFDGGKSVYLTNFDMLPAAWLDDNVRHSPEGARLLELLNVDPDVLKREWLLQDARTVAGPDFANLPNAPRQNLKLRMRSLHAVITLYSYIVDVPPGDEANGCATDLTPFREAVARGEVHDFPKSVQIKWCDHRPASAFLAVKYRGLWFYIDDGDRNTKMIFNTLYDLWQLSVKPPASQTTPVTTISVN